ncbi:cobalamin-dependent protein, partial [bacterium]|nr:cobalamin-dependent protein [bacterium]
MTKKHCLLFSFNSKYTQSNIAIHYMDSYCKKYNPECEFETFELSVNWPFQDALAKVYHKVKDILAISCYIWNIDRTIELLRSLKLIRPDLTIILGGYEVSFDSLTYLEQGLCDYVVSGEGEVIFSNLIRAVCSDEDVSKIKGISYKSESGRCIKNLGESAIADLDSIPSPFQNNPEILDKTFTYYESTRGCVYKCHFCLSAL